MINFGSCGIFTTCENENIIKSVSFLSLTPGDKINQIGQLNKNGKETSTSRIDKFTLLLTYKGIIEEDNNKWICFEVPEEGGEEQNGN